MTLACVASGKYRVLHDSNGRELHARLLSFDPQSSKVKLQLRNGKIRETPLSVFSAEDQTSIRDWHISETVLSDKNLFVRISKKGIKSDGYHSSIDGWGGVYSGIKCKDIAYEIALENKSKASLCEIKLEYGIYYRYTEEGETRYTTVKRGVASDGHPARYHNTISSKNNPKKTTVKSVYGTFSIEDLPSKETYKNLTTQICLRAGEESKEMKYTEHKNKPDECVTMYREVENKSMGVVCRISIPLSSGGYARKEYAYPTDLLKKITVDWDALKSAAVEAADKPTP